MCAIKFPTVSFEEHLRNIIIAKIPILAEEFCKVQILFLFKIDIFSRVVMVLSFGRSDRVGGLQI